MPGDEENKVTHVFTREEAAQMQTDLTAMRVSFAEIKGMLHSSPCEHLCTHMAKQSENTSNLHKRLDEHQREHHSAKSFNAIWTTIGTNLSPLIAAAALMYMIFSK